VACDHRRTDAYLADRDAERRWRRRTRGRPSR
jgi:hypothetical protein